MLRKLAICSLVIGLFSLGLNAGIVTQAGPRLSTSSSSSSSGGTNVDGATISLTGPSETKPNVEWLGGLNGVIDGATNGVDFTSLGRSGWSDLVTCTRHPSITNERGLNRTKTLLFDTRSTGEYKQTLFFDTGASGFRSFYFSGWYYLDYNTLTTGILQWKMMRWAKNQTVVDGTGIQTYMTNRRNVAGFMNWFNNTGANNFNMWWDDPGMSQLPDRGAWYRIEVELILNSSVGATDGVFRVRATNTSGSVVVNNVRTNIDYRAGSDASGDIYRWYVQQNYFGNADVGADSGSCSVTAPTANNSNAFAVAWLDDPWIAWSTTAGSSSSNPAAVRAELCNSATYSSATVCTINEIVSISGTNWTIKLNKGRHSASDLTGLWMHMFNAAGTDTVVQITQLFDPPQLRPANDPVFEDHLRLAA